MPLWFWLPLGFAVLITLALAPAVGAGRALAFGGLSLLVAPVGPYACWLAWQAYGKPAQWWALGAVLLVGTALMAHVILGPEPGRLR